MKRRSVGLISIPEKGDKGATWAHSESLSAVMFPSATLSCQVAAGRDQPPED